MIIEPEIQPYFDKKYRIECVKNNNRFSFFLPELGLMTSHEKIEQAYLDMELAMHQYFKNYIDAGLAEAIPEPQTATQWIRSNPAVLVSIGLILATLLLMGGMILFVPKMIIRSSRDFKEELKEYIQGELPLDIYRSVHMAPEMDKYLSEDQKKELVDQIKTTGE